MGIFSDRYLEEGYYEVDELGSYTKVDTHNIDKFIEVLENDKLMYSDGYTISVVNSGLNGKNNRFDDIE
jgi:hypothetical protein